MLNAMILSRKPAHAHHHGVIPLRRGDDELLADARQLNTVSTTNEPASTPASAANIGNHRRTATAARGEDHQPLGQTLGARGANALERMSRSCWRASAVR